MVDHSSSETSPKPAKKSLDKRQRRLSQIAAALPVADPEVAAMQRARLSAIQSRSSSFRGFTEDELDMLFPLLAMIEVRACLPHAIDPSAAHAGVFVLTAALLRSLMEVT